MAKKQTLYQILRKTGMFATKEELIDALRNGKVAIDGRVTKNQKFQLNPNTKIVTVEGVKIEILPLRYFIINKPERTSCQNGEHRSYVRDLIPVDAVWEAVFNSLFCVGRLDVPTTGLLIITNDGSFSSKILKPESGILKKYKVKIKDPIDQVQINILKRGVDIILKDGNYHSCLPAKVEKLHDHELLISITEGKFRQVRKMLEAVGNLVVSLERIAIGGLELGDLDLRKFKELTSEEIKEKVFSN